MSKTETPITSNTKRIDNLFRMAVFAHVVAAGSFTAAADELDLSRSAISKAVSILEEWLGVRLLYRTTRRLALTEEGRIFNEHCKRILAEAEAAELATTHLQSVPHGTVRISAPVSFGQMQLNRILPAFMERYPDLNVEIDYSDHFVDVIDAGYDVVIRVTPELQDSSLVARRIATSERFVVAAPRYIAVHGYPKTPDEVVDHNCIIYSLSPKPKIWTMIDTEGNCQQICISGNLTVNKGEAVLKAAVEGLGIARLPSFMCTKEIADGRLVRLLTDITLPPLGIYTIYPHKQYLANKVRIFVDFLVEHFTVIHRPPYCDREQKLNRAAES
ncbi:MAG: LysR family transcriptional regulator [Geminicoccaceae bacterium]